MHLGPLDYIFLACVAVGALFLAADTVVRQKQPEKRLVDRLPQAIRSPKWNYLPLALMIVAALVLMVRATGLVGQPEAPASVAQMGPPAPESDETTAPLRGEPSPTEQQQSLRSGPAASAPAASVAPRKNYPPAQASEMIEALQSLAGIIDKLNDVQGIGDSLAMYGAQGGLPPTMRAPERIGTREERSEWMKGQFANSLQAVGAFETSFTQAQDAARKLATIRTRDLQPFFQAVEMPQDLRNALHDYRSVTETILQTNGDFSQVNTSVLDAKSRQFSAAWKPYKASLSKVRSQIPEKVLELRQ